MSRTYDELLTEMQAAFAAAAGFQADDAGDVGIRLRLLAEELFTLQSTADFLKRQVFPQSAEGKYLEEHAMMRGLSRKQASYARGTLEFMSEAPAELDILLPVGTVCTTSGELNCQFRTLSAVTLRKGQTSAQALAEASLPGKAGNAAAGTVVNLIHPISGISGVRNPAPFTGGTEAEEDGSLRERLLLSYPQVSNGANLQYYLEKALAFEEVVSASLLPRARGAGTLDVAVRTRTGSADTELLRRIQQAVEENREFCMDVAARSGKEKSVAMALMVQADPGWTTEEITAAVQEAVRRYVDSLPMGEPLLLGHLGAKLLELEGVKNYRVLAPYADVTPQADEWFRATATVLVYR